MNDPTPPADTTPAATADRIADAAVAPIAASVEANRARLAEHRAALAAAEADPAGTDLELLRRRVEHGEQLVGAGERAVDRVRADTRARLLASCRPAAG